MNKRDAKTLARQGAQTAAIGLMDQVGYWLETMGLEKTGDDLIDNLSPADKKRLYDACGEVEMEIYKIAAGLEDKAIDIVKKLQKGKGGSNGR